MARILIVGGGCRGLGLTRELAGAGHAVRVTTRDEDGRAGIEAAGGECWIGDPDRIASLRLALDGITVACWLLGTATGDPEAVEALHGSRLRFMLGQLIDTTVRGLVYEARGSVAPAVLASGAAMVGELCGRNAIPLRLLEVDPADAAAWRPAAGAAIASLLGPGRTPNA
jgi:nucleoside-diphosphate-sugar epimerase